MVVGIINIYKWENWELEDYMFCLRLYNEGVERRFEFRFDLNIYVFYYIVGFVGR